MYIVIMDIIFVQMNPKKSFNYLNNEFNDGCGGDDDDDDDHAEEEERVYSAPCSYSRYLLCPLPPSPFFLQNNHHFHHQQT